MDMPTLKTTYLPSILLIHTLKIRRELKSTKNEKTSITVEWNDNSDNEKGFIVEVSTDNKTFTEAGRTAANVNTLQINNLAENTLHYFRVQAFGENDVISVYSPVLQTMTTEPFRPDASTVVAPANGGEAKVLDIVLQWKNTTLEYFGKTIYDVYMGTADDDLQLIAGRHYGDIAQSGGT